MIGSHKDGDKVCYYDGGCIVVYLTTFASKANNKMWHEEYVKRTKHFCKRVDNVIKKHKLLDSEVDAVKRSILGKDANNDRFNPEET